MASKEWEHKELERLSEQLTFLQSTVNKIHIEIAVLKVKSGLWGVIGGAIPFAVYFLSKST